MKVLYLVLCFSILLLPLSVMAEPVSLLYSPETGSSWTIKAETVAKIPMLGTKKLSLSYDLYCEGQQGSIYRMDLQVPAVDLGNGEVVGPIEAKFDLSPLGEVSNLQSSQMGDPRISAVLKNIGMIFPRLPGGLVENGDQWTCREIFYLPPATSRHRHPKAPRLPEKVRLDAQFEFSGLDSSGKGATISMKLKEASGEPIKVSFSGEGCHRVDLGYGTKANFGGNIKVRKLFMWVTVPVSVSSWMD